MVDRARWWRSLPWFLSPLFLANGALPQGDLADEFEAALEVVHRHVLSRCGELAGAIAEDVAQLRDPRGSYEAFKAYVSEMEKALDDVGRGIRQSRVRDEQTSLGEYQRLRSTGVILSEVHRLRESYMAALSHGCARWKGEFEKTLAEMERAANAGPRAIFTEEEAQGFAKRFDELQRQAILDFDKTALLLRLQLDRARQYAREAGKAGESLARATETMAARVEEGIARVREREGLPLHDWRRPGTPWGKAFLQYSKDADARFREALTALERVVRDLAIEAKAREFGARYDAVLAAANQERTRDVLGVDGEDFLASERSVRQKRAECLSKREQIEKDLLAYDRAARERIERAFSELVVLAPDAEATARFAKHREQIFDREMDRLVEPWIDRARSSGEDLPEFRALAAKAVLLGKMDHEIRAFLLFVKGGHGALAASLGGAGLKSIDALPEFVGQMPRAVQNFTEIVKDYRFTKVYEELQAEARAVGFRLEWTQWNRRKLALDWSEKVASTWVSHIGMALKVARGLAEAHEKIGRFRNLINGRDAHLDEFIDDPDAFMATYVTNDMFDVLDGIDFRTLEACRGQLSAEDFQKVMVAEIESLDRSLRALTKQAEGEEAEILEGAVDAYLNVLWGSTHRGAQTMDQIAEDMIRMALRRKQERDSERAAWRSSIERELRELASEVARTGARQREFAPRLAELDRRLTGDALANGAERATHEKERAAFAKALKGFEEDVRAALRK